MRPLRPCPPRWILAILISALPATGRAAENPPAFWRDIPGFRLKVKVRDGREIGRWAFPLADADLFGVPAGARDPVSLASLFRFEVSERFWGETPTHRVKLILKDGKEIGRWSYPRPGALPTPPAPSRRPTASAPKAAPSRPASSAPEIYWSRSATHAIKVKVRGQRAIGRWAFPLDKRRPKGRAARKPNPSALAARLPIPDPEILWRETATHRIKIKLSRGIVLGRWKFEKNPR